MSEKASCRPPSGAPRNAGETRKRILRAAKLLFAGNGYENVGTRAIADAAGINISLINRYFGSKKKLFAEVVSRLGRFSDTAGGSKERAFAAFDALLGGEPSALMMEEFRLILFSALSPQVSDIIGNFLTEKRDEMTATIPGKHSKVKADLVFAMFMGVALIFCMFPTGHDEHAEKEYAREYLQGMLDTFFADEEADGGPSVSGGEL